MGSNPVSRTKNRHLREEVSVFGSSEVCEPTTSRCEARLIRRRRLARSAGQVVGSNPVSRTKTEDFLLKILGFQCHMSSCCGCQFSFSSLVVVNTSGTSSDFNAGLHGAAGLTLVLVKGMAVDVQGSVRLRVSEKPRHGGYIRSACDQKACVCMA